MNYQDIGVMLFLMVCAVGLVSAMIHIIMNPRTKCEPDLPQPDGPEE